MFFQEEDSLKKGKTWLEPWSTSTLLTCKPKLDCFHRLQSGVSDGRKSNKGKTTAVMPNAQDDTTTSTSPPSPSFIAKEYAALKEAGIEEEEEIENIINMR